MVQLLLKFENEQFSRSFFNLDRKSKIKAHMIFSQ